MDDTSVAPQAARAETFPRGAVTGLVDDVTLEIRRVASTISLVSTHVIGQDQRSNLARRRE